MAGDEMNPRANAVGDGLGRRSIFLAFTTHDDLERVVGQRPCLPSSGSTRSFSIALHAPA